MGRRRSPNRTDSLPPGIRPGRTPGTLEVRVTAPATRGADGRLRYRQVTKTVRGGVRDAIRVQAQLRLTRDQMGGIEGTVSWLLARWLDSIDSERSPTTMSLWRGCVTRHINPAIGDMRLTAVTPRTVADLYQSLTAKGLSPSRVRECHTILRQAFAEAVHLRELPANPAERARLPKRRAPSHTPPDPAGVLRLISVATAADPEWGCYLRVAAATGARRGELCGLRWGDVSGTQMVIRRAIIEPAPGVLVAKAPKTNKSRAVALDGGTRAALADHLLRVQARAERMGWHLTDDSYVFSHDGLTPWAPDPLSKRFTRLARQAGVACRLHDLRHFAATQLIAGGMDVVSVAGRLGHSSPNVTLAVYAHAVRARDETAADILGQLLDGPLTH